MNPIELAGTPDSLVEALERVVAELGELAGNAPTVDKDELQLRRNDAGVVMGGPVFRTTTSFSEKDDKSVGLILGRGLGLRLSAGVLMLPDVPGEPDDEVMEAVDEIFNRAVGFWNGAVDEKDRWESSVEARTVSTQGNVELAGSLRERESVALVMPIDYEGSVEHIAVYGPIEWLCPNGWTDPVSEAESSESAPAEGGEPEEDERDPDRHDSLATAVEAETGMQATVVIVDESGELLEWIQGQMEKRRAAFARGPLSPYEVTPGATLLVIGASPSWFETIEARQRITIRG